MAVMGYRQRGIVAIEFALLAVPSLLIAAACVDLGRGAVQDSLAMWATTTAATAAANGASTDVITATAVGAAQGALVPADIAISPAACAARVPGMGASVTVQTRHNFVPITPLLTASLWADRVSQPLIHSVNLPLLVACSP